MNCMKIALALALCVAVAVSTPCTDTCTGSCDIAKNQCDLAVILDPLCGVVYGSCMMGCGNVCGCIDGCSASCAPAKETCDANASNMLAKAQCVVEQDVCVADCQAICGAQKTVETVQAAVQMGLGQIGM